MCKKKIELYNTPYTGPLMFKGPEDEDVVVLRQTGASE